MQAVILCGGKATRLHPLSRRVAKSMVVIRRKPFLKHQLTLFRRYDIRHIVLCVGKFSDQIQRYFGDGHHLGLQIQYSHDGKIPFGTGGALKKAQPLLEEMFFVMYGDSFLPFNFLKPMHCLQKTGKLGLMVFYRNRNRIERSNVKVRRGMVKTYGKDLPHEQMDCIDYGVSIFRKKALEILPAHQPADLSLLHQTLIRRKELLAFEAKRRFYQIGSLDGLREFERYASKHRL